MEKFDPSGEGYPGLHQVTDRGGPSHLSRKSDQSLYGQVIRLYKSEIIWTGQVPYRVTSPNWGPPP